MIKNEYSKLKKCIVGREFSLSPKIFDISFKVFFRENLEELDYCQEFENEYTSEVIGQRNEDLDNLAKTLEKYDVEVLRPDTVEKVLKVQTPNFTSIFRPSSNVRDQCLIYKNTIYETAPSLRGRFFENNTLYNIFKKLYSTGMNWVQVPKSPLTDECIDTEKYDSPRDFSRIDPKFDMFFDSANCLKMNDDLFYNYSSYNHFLGIKWLKDNVDANIIPLKLTDNHIDGCIASLNDHTFLVNDKKLHTKVRDVLPKKYKDFTFLELDKSIKTEDEVTLPHLASQDGMSINVLSIDPKTVLCNKSDYHVCELLDKNGFNVVPVQLRYCRAFGGGIHCSTLDIERE